VLLRSAHLVSAPANNSPAPQTPSGQPPLVSPEHDDSSEQQPTGLAAAVAASLAALTGPLAFLTQWLTAAMVQAGAVGLLIADLARWLARSINPKHRKATISAVLIQVVRVGVRSTFIVCLVSGCVGFILVLQMVPPLDEFGRKDLVANILGVAVLRELGPLIAAIVLTGFAGASIAAELGTMVVGEEIEALEASAIHPIRFLVLPRVAATVLAMLVLAVLSDVVSIGSGLLAAWGQFQVPPSLFMENLLAQTKLLDFYTGVAKGGVFGLIIGLIACSNGLRVTGGAAGVGRATTSTVVQSVVCIVIADLIFTYLFVVWRL